MTKDREADIRDNPFRPNGRSSEYLESALRDVLAALDVARKRTLILNMRINKATWLLGQCLQQPESDDIREVLKALAESDA